MLMMLDYALMMPMMLLFKFYPHDLSLGRDKIFVPSVQRRVEKAI
jgi:hypothetical protein